MSHRTGVTRATAEAAVSLNNLDVSPQQFVNFCGRENGLSGPAGGVANMRR